MKNKDYLLTNELSNWDKFLNWLEKINFRKAKSQINEPEKQPEVSKWNLKASQNQRERIGIRKDLKEIQERTQVKKRSNKFQKE